MGYKSVFRRYELKYLLTYEQKATVLSAMEKHMQLDQYGRTTIRNLYFDDDSYRLIRRSIEKPDYKEKLRVRSYAEADDQSEVFVELKKKYDGVVYKRRIALPYITAMDWLTGRAKSPIDCQICREIDYFKSYYAPLHPSVFLSYEREAYFERSGGDFRVTFDDSILARTTELSLASKPCGKAILPEGRVMMEIKCSGAIPLWMVEVLSREKIYKTSFSKYGRAYADHILPELTNIDKELMLNA